MSSDTYDRATVELDSEDSRGYLGRTIDALQESFSQTIETVTRQARFEISGGGVDTVDAPDNLDELVDQAKNIGFVWKAFQVFANEVWEPGYRLEGPDETLAFFLGDVDEVDAQPPEGTPEGGFLDNCGVYGGVKHSDFYHIGKQSTFQRRVRGTVLVELLKNDIDTPIPETKITGFNFVRPETISAETYPYSNILIEPEDTDIAGVELTRRGEAAAYIQWEDSSLLGRTGRLPPSKQDEEIPLSQHDLRKQVLNPGIGDDASEEQGVFGTSEIEPISEDIAEYRQIKRDRATAIQNKAHGVFFIEHGREVLDLGNNQKEVIEWDDSSMDDFEADLSSLEPGGYVTHDGSINVERKEGGVPDLTDDLQQIINDIFSALPVPKYKVGFEDDVNRDVTSEQSDDYMRLIDEEREYQERWWTEQLKLVARSWDLPTENLKLKIEPEPEDSPVLSLSKEEIDKLNTYAKALTTLAGPQAGPQQLVDVETLLTDVAQLPEEVNEIEEIEPEQTENPDAMAEFMDIMGHGGDTDSRGIDTDFSDTLAGNSDRKTRVEMTALEKANSREQALRKLLKELPTNQLERLEVAPTQGHGVTVIGVGSKVRVVATTSPILIDGKNIRENWVAVVKTTTSRDTLDWNPALHPRDPETGRFVERPFNVPSDLVSSVENVSELSPDEIVDRVNIPDDVRIDNFESDNPPEIDQPKNANEAAKIIAGAIINQDKIDASRTRGHDRENLIDVWSERLKGGFENRDEEMMQAVAVAQEQNQENDEFAELVESTGVSTEAIHLNPEGANYERLAETAQAERKGDVTLIYSQELGTKSTEPVEPEPGDSVSSKDIATILRHEAAHSMWDTIPREDREWFTTKGITDDIVKNLTGYAGQNSEEAFAELIAVTTHPKFDAGKYPDEVVELKEEIVSRMKSA